MRETMFQLRDVLRRTEISAIVILLITAGVFIAIFGRGDAKAMADALSRADATLILFACVLAAIGFLFRALRFWVLARWTGMRTPIAFMSLCYAAGFAMSATPGRVGEIVRLWLLKRRFGYPYQRSLPLMLADRAYDLLALLALCVIGVDALAGYSTPAIICAIVLLSGMFLLTRPRWSLRLLSLIYGIVGCKARLFARLRHLVRDTAVLFDVQKLLGVLPLSIVAWSVEALVFYLCINSLTNVASLQGATFIFAFSVLMGNLTFLPGGAGGVELTMVALITSAGAPFESAVVVTMMFRLCTFWFAIVFGLVCLGVVSSSRSSTEQKIAERTTSSIRPL